MFPYSNIYNPYNSYSSPFVTGYGDPDAEYSRALAEEQAARRQYAAALRSQEEAQRRAAQARLARQAYEQSYLDEDDPYEYHPSMNPYGSMPGMYGFSPRDRYIAQQRALVEEQRRRELLRQQELLELERERERERARLLEEERQRRQLEEERRRLALLEEENGRRDQQRQSQCFSTFNPLEELFGFRPNPDFSEGPASSRRARTRSPRRPTRIPVHSPSPAPELPRGMSQSPPDKSPIHQTCTPSESHSSSPAPEPKKPEFSPEQLSAAHKILHFYRLHYPRISALKQIAAIQNQFEQLKAEFELPEKLDYRVTSDPDEAVAVPTAPWLEEQKRQAEVAEESMEGDEESESSNSTPKLAYTSNNASVHKFDDSLQRLLTKLDAIESQGDVLVRQRRRQVVGIVEKESERANTIGRNVWKAWKRSQEVKEMEVDTGAQHSAEEAQATPREQVVQAESAVSPSDSVLPVDSTTDTDDDERDIEAMITDTSSPLPASQLDLELDTPLSESFATPEDSSPPATIKVMETSETVPYQVAAADELMHGNEAHRTYADVVKHGTSPLPHDSGFVVVNKHDEEPLSSIAPDVVMREASPAPGVDASPVPTLEPYSIASEGTLSDEEHSLTTPRHSPTVTRKVLESLPQPESEGQEAGDSKWADSRQDNLAKSILDQFGGWDDLIDFF